jgi:hypothetical protein
MFTIRSPRKLVALFGRENVLFLSNEDMLPAVAKKRGGVLDQLSNFTGLDRSQFDPETYSVVTNCNDKKGMKMHASKRGRTHMRSLAAERYFRRRGNSFICIWGKSVKYGLENLAFSTPTV